MSQKASRKSAVSEEKEKSADTPVKEMKKKMAANAEKEKQAAEKVPEKPADKPEKSDKAGENSGKGAEKPDKSAEKADKGEKAEKKTDKAEKKQEKQVEKKAEAPAEKKEEKESSSKDDKSGKAEKPDQKKAEKPKQNGKSVTNGTHDENGTVSAADDDDDDELVIDDRDEMFPELTYDDTSDPEFEPPTPEGAGRSFTRRSQAKATRTPETPRPASDKQADTAAEDPSRDSKVLKLKEDTPSTDRKLRSADSPKPQEPKKAQEKPQESSKKSLEVPSTSQESQKPQESQQKPQESKDGKQDGEAKDQEEKENGEASEKVAADVVIEIDGDDEPRKTDTNYSKSRVKVSPYRRSMRLADQTLSSIIANYTGNNTTMEMDISESSLFVSQEEPSLDDSSYLSGLRSIRGRRSYKPLKEMTLRHIGANRSAAKAEASAEQPAEPPARPTGTVVGRKRKPDNDGSIEYASEVSEALSAVHSKRMRLLDRLTHSFRRSASSTPNPNRRGAEVAAKHADLYMRLEEQRELAHRPERPREPRERRTASSTPLPARRAAEIVGINTDLPLTAPVASPPTFDPEALKPAPTPDIVSPDVCLATPPTVATPIEPERDGKRCVIM